MLEDCSPFLIVTIVAISYFLGAIPSGYLIGKLKGVDIRKQGSGNIGATNAFRILGAKAASVVLLADAFKGFLSCLLAPIIATEWTGVPISDDTASLLMIIAGLGAILGHSFTFWLKFKGGKGIATSAGVFLTITPLALGICLLVFSITIFLSRYVSLSSILAAICLPFSVYLIYHNLLISSITVVIALLVIYRHRSNIKRITMFQSSRISFHQRNSSIQCVRHIHHIHQRSFL